jgi:hypothetical protein
VIIVEQTQGIAQTELLNDTEEAMKSFYPFKDNLTLDPRRRKTNDVAQRP